MNRLSSLRFTRAPIPSLILPYLPLGSARPR
jgi:hypothetical protein